MSQQSCDMDNSQDNNFLLSAAMEMENLHQSSLIDIIAAGCPSPTASVWGAVNSTSGWSPDLADFPPILNSNVHLENHVCPGSPKRPRFGPEVRPKRPMPGLIPIGTPIPAQVHVSPQPGPSSRLEPLVPAIIPALHNDFKHKTCPLCELVVNEYYELCDHLLHAHPEYYSDFVQIGGGAPVQMDKFLSVHGGITTEYRAKIDQVESNLQRFIQDSRNNTIQIIKNELVKKKNVKIYIQLTGTFTKPNDDQEILGQFSSYCMSILRQNQINKTLKICTDKIEADVADYTNERSGLVLKSIDKFSIVITTYRPLHGSEYIKLPFPLCDKQCFLNVDNQILGQEKCFKWSVLAHEKLGGKQFKNDPHNKSRKNKLVKSYLPYQHLINDKGIKYPMTIDQIPKFEELNPKIAITLLGYEDEGEKFRKEKDEVMRKYKIIKNNLMLLYNTSTKDREIQIDLLLIMQGEKQHFVLIHSLSALLCHPNNHRARYICRNCLQAFLSTDTLNAHTEFCANLGLQKTSFPEENHLKFKHYYRTQKLAFRFYADFESLLVDTDEPIIEGKGRNLQKHMPCGYAWTCIDYEGKIRESSYYRAKSFEEDVSARMVQEIKDLTEELEDEIKEFQDTADHNMTMTEAEQDREHGNCHFCKRPLSEEVYDVQQDIVRHHDHFPPHNFLGLAHNICNLQASIRVEFPVFIHNGGNYDFHFLIKSLSKLKNDEIIDEVSVIPKTCEKFLSVTIDKKIRFVDSLAFTMGSLDSLVKTMVKNGTDAFKTVKSEFSGTNVDFLFQKGCYPYSYMKTYENFQETQLPPKSAFYNDLSEEDLSDEMYQHAQQVWEAFGCETMGDYHDLYVRLDTALLADVMENTRSILYEKYELDVGHYYSIPMVAMDGLLKLTGVQLEYIKDPTMHLWVEHAIRGGYCGPSSLRAAEANNKYMGDEYKPEKESSYLLYIDANNLYGWAMNQCLPTHGFKWLENEDLEEIQADPAEFINRLGDDEPDGYMFEVDLDIPENMHDKLNDYPPAPIKRSVDESELSKSYQTTLAEDLEMNKASLNTKKLIKDLHNKKKYICHYRILKTYVKMGCKITKVHRAVKFQQSKWMKEYIDTNTSMRNMATSDFEKNFWKLMNNAAFGKMIEQKRNRQNVHMVLDGEKAARLNKKPTVQSIIPIDEDLSIYLLKRLNVLLDKPIIVGVCILELAKNLMYEMHYDCIQPFYGDRARMVYTDTDSLIYHLKTEDMFKDMQANSTYFDMSEYDPTHPIFGKFKSDENKKILGKFKDEYHNKIITRIAAPRPKMYALRSLSLPMENGKYSMKRNSSGAFKMQNLETKRAKGISRTATKNQLRLEQYVQVLEESKQTFVTMKNIISKKHDVNTVLMYKKAINGFCNKRFSIDSVNSLAYGHKDTSIYEY